MGGESCLFSTAILKLNTSDANRTPMSRMVDRLLTHKKKQAYLLSMSEGNPLSGKSSLVTFRFHIKLRRKESCLRLKVEINIRVRKTNKLLLTDSLITF